MALMTEECSQAVETFAESVQNTETWRQWNEAQQDLEGNETLMRLFARYEELTGAMRQASAQGGGLSGEQMVELAQVRDGIVNDAAYIRREETSEQLTRLLRGLNSLLTKRLGVDFAAMAAPKSGCCG